MARTTNPTKTAVNVTITRNWQLTFIAVMVLAQLFALYYLVDGLLHYARYFKDGTFIYQSVQNLYPVLYALAGWIFARNRVVGTMPKLFWAVFVAVIGLAVYSTTQLPLLFMSHWVSAIAGSNGKAWYQGIYWMWAQMAVVFALYCGGLWYIKRRSGKA